MKEITYEGTKEYLEKVKKASWLLVIFNCLTSLVILFIIAAVLDEIFGDGKLDMSDMFYGNIWNVYSVILTIFMIIYIVVVSRKNKSIYPKKYIVIGIFGIFGGFVLGLQILSLIFAYRDLKSLTPDKVERYNKERQEKFAMLKPQYPLSGEAFRAQTFEEQMQMQSTKKVAVMKEDKGYLQVVGLPFVRKVFMKQFIRNNGSSQIIASDLNDGVIYQLNPGEYQIATQLLNEPNKRAITITPGEITTLHVSGTRYNYIFSILITLELFALFTLYNAGFFAGSQSTIATLICLSVAFFPYAIGRHCRKIEVEQKPITPIINLDEKLVPNKIIGDELIEPVLDDNEERLKIEEIKQNMYQNVNTYKQRLSEKKKERMSVAILLSLFVVLLIVRNIVFLLFMTAIFFFVFHSVLLVLFPRRKSFIISLVSSLIYLSVCIFDINLAYVIYEVAIILIIALIIYNAVTVSNVDVFVKKFIKNYMKQSKTGVRSVQFTEKMIRIAKNESLVELPLKGISSIRESEHYYYIVGNGVRYNHLRGGAQAQTITFIVSKDAYFKNGFTISDMKHYIEESRNIDANKNR